MQNKKKVKDNEKVGVSGGGGSENKFKFSTREFAAVALLKRRFICERAIAHATACLDPAQFASKNQSEAN